MGPSWRELGAIDRRIARIALLVLAAYLVGAGALGDAALTGAIGLGTLATMLPMLAMSMQLGTVSAVDVAVESMLAAVPDLDTLTERLAAAPAAGARDVGDRPARGVRFEAVRFRYPDAAADVLRGVDLTLQAGVSHALVGANGAGKTTLVALLAGLHAPTGGRLAVDDVALGELDARAWQQRIAVVSQDALYLPLSARENVTLAGLRGEPVDEAALAHAAHQAGADAVVAGLAHGWDTVLSPRYPGGTELSGGQWQRIVLARALYAVARGARILVLDEPTAQLDVRAEAAFHDRFLELTAGTTSVVISHRFSTVRRAARIAVLEDGVITELGDHATLMAAGGRYAELYELQAAAFREPA
jgi:ATP-binding cassette subfamily B protein